MPPETDIDPITFYDILPSDVDVSSAPSIRQQWNRLLNVLISSTFDTTDQESLDVLTEILLNGRWDDLSQQQIRDLADHFSTLYVHALSGKSPNVRKKMSIQRLNFFLRNLLVPLDFVETDSSEHSLPYPCPWDWAQSDDQEIFVVSRTPNVIICKSGNETCLDLGLPTQVDFLHDGIFSIGSYYSDGLYTVRDKAAEFVPHNAPALLLFSIEGNPCFIDCHGQVIDLDSRKLISMAPTRNVSRVRRFGNQLFVMDWTVASRIHVMDLEDQTWRSCQTPGVFLSNDLLKLRDDIFVIDKQQGHIFKFDSSFQFIEKRCHLGRGPGMLFDPIAIHASADQSRLEVMNWVPGNIVSVPAF